MLNIEELRVYPKSNGKLLTVFKYTSLTIKLKF